MNREQVILRGLAIFGAVWQVLWLAAEPGLRELIAQEPTDPSAIAIALSLAAWLALWPALLWRGGNRNAVQWLQFIIVVSLSVAAVVLIVGARSAGPGGWLFGASVMNLAVGLAGLSFPRVVGAGVVAVLVFVESVVVVTVHGSGGDLVPLAQDLIYPLYALALGAAAWASRHSLISSAHSQDQAAAELQLQEQVRATTEFADASVTAAETRLHETVLNTLTAIDRGGFADDEATSVRLRERAAESADVLRRVVEGADVSSSWVGDLSVDLATAFVDLEARGVAIHTRGSLALSDGNRWLSIGGRQRVARSTAEEYVAMGTALRELLLNVSRHASATNVWITSEVVRSRGRDRWRITVRDDGRGFDPRALGFGLRSVVIYALHAVEGRAVIESEPGAGTEVILEVPLPVFGERRKLEPAGTLQSIATPVLVAFAAFTFYVFLATWEFATSPIANVIAIVIFFGCVGLVLAVRAWGNADQVPWWLVLVVGAAVPAMTTVESLAGSPGGPTADWSSEAGSALLFVIVAAGPWWAAPVALASWFIAQEARLIELTQPGTIVIVVAAVLGWSLRKSAAGTRTRRSEIQVARQALAQSQERLARSRRRFADLDPEGLIELLDAIACGDRDPNDPEVREECARQERLIRSVLLLHQESNDTHHQLVRLAVFARDHGIDLSIAAVPQLPEQTLFHAFPTARNVLGAATQDAPARASVSIEGEEVVFRLVATVDVHALAGLAPAVEVLDPTTGVVAVEERCDFSAHRQRWADGGISHVTGTK